MRDATSGLQTVNNVTVERCTVKNIQTFFCPVEIFKKDPKLAMHVFFGPCTPYQFRLTGTGRWEGARDAIMTTMDRVRFPLATRCNPQESKSAVVPHLLKLLIIIAAVILLRFLFA